MQAAATAHSNRAGKCHRAFIQTNMLQLVKLCLMILLLLKAALACIVWADWAQAISPLLTGPG
eukprot:246502-Pelagomonas_calceolata.AAC.5